VNYTNIKFILTLKKEVSMNIKELREKAIVSKYKHLYRINLFGIQTPEKH